MNINQDKHIKIVCKVRHDEKVMFNNFAKVIKETCDKDTFNLKQDLDNIMARHLNPYETQIFKLITGWDGEEPLSDYNDLSDVLLNESIQKRLPVLKHKDIRAMRYLAISKLRKFGRDIIKEKSGLIIK